MMIEKFAEMIKECSRIVFFGGVGVSTKSGVKDYRSQDGLYNIVKEYDVPPEEILCHDFFLRFCRKSRANMYRGALAVAL